jgi:hypothetical protein
LTSKRVKLTSGTTILSMFEFSISGAFEKLRFPVLAMNCGCPDVEPVAAISLFLYTILLEPCRCPLFYQTMADRKGLLGPSAASPKRTSNGATREKPKIEQLTMGLENIGSFQRKAICCKAQKSWVICCKSDTMGPTHKKPREEFSH